MDPLYKHSIEYENVFIDFILLKDDQLALLSANVFNSNFFRECLGEAFIYKKPDPNIDEINIIYDFFDALNKSSGFNQEKKDEERSTAILRLVREIVLKINFTDGLAFDLLRAWKYYECIIFGINQFYREHFIHQFHVFLLGCLFLEKVYVQFKIVFSKKRFFRRWFLASMFHDIGYPAESLGIMQSTLHNRFFNKIPGYGIEPIQLKRFCQDDNLEELFFNLAIIHLFSENVSLFSQQSNTNTPYSFPLKEIVNLLRDEYYQTKDHGVTGAVYFLKTALIDLREIVVDPNTSSHATSLFSEYEPYTHLMDDLFIAAAAISGHNLRVNTYRSYTVDFSTRPIASLLILCDDLQEFDRRRSFVQRKTVEFYLESVVVSDPNNLSVAYTCVYGNDTSSDNSQTLPTHLDIKDSIISICKLFYINLSDINTAFYKTITFKFNGISFNGNNFFTMEFTLDDKPESHRFSRYKIDKITRDLLVTMDFRSVHDDLLI